MRKKWTRVLVLVGVLSGLVAYYVMNLNTFLTPLQPGRKLKMPPKFETTWQKEDDWIIQSILSDIYGMVVSYAYPEKLSYDDLSVDIQRIKYENPASKLDPTVYKIEASLPHLGEKIVFELNFEDDGANIFSPQVYWNWARTLIDLMVTDLPPTLHSREDNSVLLRALLSPTSGILERENQDISRRLANNMLSPADHDAAAVLVGMLAMRDASGRYRDLRPSLCRMTAHLSIAQALAPRSTENDLRTIGLSVHHLLLDSQVRALDEIGGLNTANENDPAAKLKKAWKDALYTRVTGDWRVLKEKSGLSLLEKMELFRALCFSLSVDRAMAWVREAEENQIPYNEAARVAAETDYSVAAGHSLLKNSLAAELQELSSLLGNDSLPNEPDQLVAYLNQTGTYAVNVGDNDTPHIKVLSPGAWAHYFQRHIMHRMENEYQFYKKRWGVETYAQQFYQYLRKHFSNLNLFPVFMRVAAYDPAETSAALQQIHVVIKKNPELLTPQCFLSFKPMKGETWPKDTALTDLQWHWYSHDLLPGTICQMAARSEFFLYHSKRLERYEKAIEIAPYHFKNIDLYCTFKDGVKITEEQIEKAYAPVCDYNMGALKTLAEKYRYKPAKEDRFIKLYRQICALDPDRYFKLGDFLAGRGRKEEAAQAYQHGVDNAIDQVNVANESEWLVFYYYENGEEDKAFKVAGKAAQVGSYVGFRTMAKLLEEMKDLDGAETYYRKIYKRYDDPGILLRFLHKHEKTPSFKAKINKLTQQIFPEGLQVISLEDATGPPEEGLVFVKTEKWMSKHALKIGDIVIAANGYIVKNKQQYLAAGAYGQGGLFGKMIVWQGTQYREIMSQRWYTSIAYALEPYTRKDG
jgi:tetratricopeptide (TPR) repeat protein